MLLSRPVAAVCASCIAHAALYPIDTLKVRSIVTTNATKHLYSGIVPHLVGQLLGTAVFMTIYEHSKSKGVPIVWSAATASASSAVPRSLLDTVKKKRQAQKQVNLTCCKMCSIYGLHLAKTVPRSCIHYFVYERLVRFLVNVGLSSFVVGGVGAAVASGLSSVMLFPLEVLRMRMIFAEDTKSWKAMRRGLSLALLQSMLSSALGHGIMEELSPRSV